MRKKIFIILIGLFLFIPLIGLNTKENQVSKLDNRNLTEFIPEKIQNKEVKFNFPLMSKQFETYLSDRIGLREQILSIYGNGYNKIFKVLKQPSYEYGKDEEVYYHFENQVPDEKFVERFNDYLLVIDRYLEGKGVDFVFAINPAKNHIYPNEVPDSVHTAYGNIDYLQTLLKKNDITYVDNIDYFQKIKPEQRLFNKKFDVGHWTDYGAVLGISHMIEPFREKHPTIGPIDFDSLSSYTQTEKYLPTSNIIINEEILSYKNKNRQSVNPEGYAQKLAKELKINPSYRTFVLSQNPNNKKAPSMLIFRGSFMNRKEFIYTDSFREVIGIHNYENIYDIDYYLNLFKVDVVLFEIAATAFSPEYFNPNSMVSLRYNLDFKVFDNYQIVEPNTELRNALQKSIEKKDILTDVFIDFPREYEHAYIRSMTTINDMHPRVNEKGSYSTYTSFYNDKFNDPVLILIDRDKETKTEIPLAEISELKK